MTIRLNSFLRDFLFLLIAVYFAQGSLYASGSVISRLSLLLILLISSVYLVKSLIMRSKKEIFYYSWTALLFLNFIGFVFGGDYSGTHFSQIRNILTALLPFFPFYYFAYKGDLLREHLLRFFMILVPVAIASFYSSRNSMILESFNDSENVVTNTSYFFVALIPYVFLWGKRKILSVVSLLLLFFFIVQGAKRGALIVGLIGVLVFVYYHLRTVNPKTRKQSFIVALLGALSLVAFIYNFYISNEFLIGRMGLISDGGSNRDIIYANLFHSWYESNSVIHYLFGFGFVSTIEQSGGALAHNDWLELLINFGLLGFFIYVLVFYALARLILNSRIEIESRLIMLAIVCMWFLQTLFSMYYTASTTVLTAVVLGYLIGSYQHKKVSTRHVKPEVQSAPFQHQKR